MKRIFALAAAAAALVACNNFRTGQYMDDLVLPLAEERPDSLFFSIDLEYVVKGMPKEAMEQVNGAIITQAFDVEEPGASLEEAALRYREALIDEYLDQADFSWEDSIEGLFTGDWKQWKNYQLSYYNFRGGAHGIQTVSQLVFDRKTGHLLTETDLFADGYLPGITPLLRQAVQSSLEQEAPELLELVDLDSVAPNGNFSVSKDGVEWVFQPYEVGPYALGLVTATVPWDKLQPYLKN